ncbi:MAG: hypothetical protein ACC631_06330, partial [Halocynthiibacter sp.]
MAPVWFWNNSSDDFTGRYRRIVIFQAHHTCYGATMIRAFLIAALLAGTPALAPRAIAQTIGDIVTLDVLPGWRTA